MAEPQHRPEEAETTLTPYDALPYISGARNASSVDRLATLGRLLGMPTAPPESCRVLELGCGDGGNLIPMAVSFPASEFVGVDLAPTAVQRGQSALRELGIENVRLVQGTFAAADDTCGEFDYIVAHGVYSWVPDAARHELLDVIRQRMAPAGVAFVSYNALPGSHIRGVLRDMMRMHTQAFPDPATKVEQARALLSLLAMAPRDAGDVYRPLLQSEVGRALQASDYLLYHDDLADISQPFFFADFMASAARHGLKFAAEANFHQMSIESMPPEIASMLAELGDRDLIAKEQYLDFMTCRSFRQTLLCHEAAAVDRGVDTERVRAFRFSSDAGRTGDKSSAGVEFHAPNGSSLRTDSTTGIAALDELVRRHPRSASFDELRKGDSDEELAEVLYGAFTVGLVDFHVSEPRAVFELSDKPLASPWARHRANTGRVVNLYHETVSVDEPTRDVLARLDGSHSASTLARELGRAESDIRDRMRTCAALGLLIG